MPNLPKEGEGKEGKTKGSILHVWRVACAERDSDDGAGIVRERCVSANLRGWKRVGGSERERRAQERPT